MAEWRDIETAPKDGRWILGLWSWEGGEIVVTGSVYWRRGTRHKLGSWMDGPEEVGDPKYWLPLSALPAPPEPSK